ncbi:GrpB family protein [Sphingobacterium sp. N143]|uniref:GrpB family protein n=1 Tax=Sphingobacterium sp. N143 TaxID=2746727 RepID=UPI0025758CF8|nr:GrpB family protein [Sphingobacterium sp. N143]MDM1293031.1 GrpB family protein [Sphingobacterium sp. N143]
MKLPFQIYDPEWKRQFELIKMELESMLGPLNPQIDHIGSTAVEGLSAKPVIDIQLGLKNESDLDRLPGFMGAPNIVYYEKYNKEWPERRFFIWLKQNAEKNGIPSIIKASEEIPEAMHDHELRVAHIHAFVKGSMDWTRHLAFREYLKAHPKVKEAYQELKEELVKQEWVDGNDYNMGKDAFLKKQEQQALKWYTAGQQINHIG